jgi:hypothetical protein
MSHRVPVRTLLSTTGICRAYNDHTIEWLTTSNNLYTLRIQALPTVLLGIKGPHHDIESIFVGCENGEVLHLSVPNLVLLESFTLGTSSIRSMARLNGSSRSVVVGTQDGEIWLAGVKVPNSMLKLFEIFQPITSLQVERDLIHVQSGWYQSTHHLDGEHVKRKLVIA